MPQAAEAAKQQYARQLAAYTLLQWNLAREKQAARDSAIARTQAPEMHENPSSAMSSNHHHAVPSGTADSPLPLKAPTEHCAFCRLVSAATILIVVVTVSSLSILSYYTSLGVADYTTPALVWQIILHLFPAPAFS
ncbi:hypothetical protein BU17DRAFT_81131 [Hysterangium stoloniferum]|nr:hypothetical protein BU17DRAFT_81131 [Hysterangium stoloniferum]